MGEDFLDKKIKDELFSYESLIDNDKLWKDIQHKQNKGRGYIFFSSFLGFAILSLSSYFIINQIQNNQADSHLSLNTKNIIAQTNETVEDLKTDKNQEALKTQIKEETSKTEKRKLDSNLSNSLNPENNLLAKSIDVKKENTSNFTLESEVINKYVQTTPISKLTYNAGQSLDNNELFKNQQILSKESEFDVELKNVARDIFKVRPSEVRKETTFKPIDLGENMGLIQVQDLDILNLKVLDQSLYELPVSVSITEVFNKNKIKCYDHKGKGISPWSVLAYTGPGLVNRTLKNLGSSSELDDYINDRNEKETILESVRAGIMLKYTHPSGLYAKVGIDFDQITERLDVSYSKDSTVIIPNQVIKVEIASNGDSIVTYGPVKDEITINTTISNYNRHKFISVPLLVGFEQQQNKWTFAAEVGVLLNTKFDFSGTILNREDPPIDRPDLFKTKTGMDLTGGIGLAYKISPNLKLWGIPSLRYHLESVTNSAYALEQKYKTVNFLLGLEWKL